MKKKNKKFGAVINCIDGRVQEPVEKYLKKHYGLDYIDVITEPGPEKIFQKKKSSEILKIKSKVEISFKKHNSKVLALAGHYDCAANPVSKKEHLKQIEKAVEQLKVWQFSFSKIVGLWVDKHWKVNIVTIYEKNSFY